MRPRTFIGSSSEGSGYAQAIASCIKDDFDVTLWKTPGTFRPTMFTLESILAFTERFDYGIFVMTADDLAKIRRKKHSITRDNVVFEAGMFLGALGRTNCFLFVSDRKNLHLPSDLEGLTYIRFKEKQGKPLSPDQVAQLVEGPCSKLRDHCTKSEASGLNGKWNQTWFVKDSKHYDGENPSEADVGVFGSRFRAEWDAKGERFQLIARISENRIITGEWSGPNKHSYHGSCQLVVERDGTSINGKWVGLRENNEVESGEWKWSRPSQVTPVDNAAPAAALIAQGT